MDARLGCVKSAQKIPGTQGASIHFGLVTAGL